MDPFKMPSPFDESCIKYHTDVGGNSSPLSGDVMAPHFAQGYAQGNIDAPKPKRRRIEGTGGPSVPPGTRTAAATTFPSKLLSLDDLPTLCYPPQATDYNDASFLGGAPSQYYGFPNIPYPWDSSARDTAVGRKHLHWINRDPSVFTGEAQRPIQQQLTWSDESEASVPSIRYSESSQRPIQQQLTWRNEHSESSIDSSISSACETLSPVNTEVPASNFESLSATASRWSRGPSPLRSISSAPSVDPASTSYAEWATAPPLAAVASTIDSHPSAGRDSEQPGTLLEERPEQLRRDSSSSSGLAGPVPGRVGGSHNCNWASCIAPSFQTREGLNWHVKADHLLICPVPGCCEDDFQSKRILDSHIRVVHPVDDRFDAFYSRTKSNRSVTPKTILPSLPTPAPTIVEKALTVIDLTEEEAEENVSTPTAPPVDAPKAPKDSPEEKALKMMLSIATSKRRCSEQLRSVLEKRAAKQRSAGTPRSLVNTPRSADSPQDHYYNSMSRLLEYATFPLIWEHSVLPFLVEFIPKWCGPGHVISVSRTKGHQNARRICIMTPDEVSRARRLTIAGHVRDLLPVAYRSHASFFFSEGVVQRLVWARGLGPSHLDEVCAPRNPFCYRSPCMGDSIGAVAAADNDDDGEVTATLGPSLVVGGANYWLCNFHPFETVYHARDAVTVEHPAPMDRQRCIDEDHDALLQQSDDEDGEEDEEDNSKDNNNSKDSSQRPPLVFKLGTVTATSGIDLKTARLSHEPYWEDNFKSPPFVTTDWTLVSSNRPRQANMLRKLPSSRPSATSASSPSPHQQEVPVTTTSPITPSSTVLVTGRTSGHQRGLVCESPAYVDGAASGTGYATREWYIEDPALYLDDDSPYDEDSWIRGGVGVTGDSGAAVIDSETNSLVGQLWGRNAYYGPGPRRAFFTPISDIFDDIQEKCGESRRPTLPMYRDEGERWVVYPECRPCFDRASYLDSRRSSRESLRSMIGGAATSSRGGADGLPPATAGETPQSQDVTELLTPKDSHLGAGWVPPATVPMSPLAAPSLHGFMAIGSSATAPGSGEGAVVRGPSHAAAEPLRTSAFLSEMVGPYAIQLDDNDLYDDGYGYGTGGGGGLNSSGKTPEGPCSAPTCHSMNSAPTPYSMMVAPVMMTRSLSNGGDRENTKRRRLV